jgi:hypothetical protein
MWLWFTVVHSVTTTEDLECPQHMTMSARIPRDPKGWGQCWREERVVPGKNSSEMINGEGDEAGQAEWRSGGWGRAPGWIVSRVGRKDLVNRVWVQGPSELRDLASFSTTQAYRLGRIAFSYFNLGLYPESGSDSVTGLGGVELSKDNRRQHCSVGDAGISFSSSDLKMLQFLTPLKFLHSSL